MELKELVEAIEKTEKFANLDLETCDYRTRTAMTGLKRESKDTLTALMAQYELALARTTAAVWVQGAAADVKAFTEAVQAESASPVLVVDAGALYRDLMVMPIRALGPNRTWEPTQTQHLLHALALLGKQLGVKSMESPRHVQSGVLAEDADVVSHGRAMVRGCLGGDLDRLVIQRNLTAQAATLRYCHRVLPVLVIGIDGADEIELLRPVFAYSTETVTVAPGLDLAGLRDCAIAVMKEVMKSVKRQMKGGI